MTEQILKKEDKLRYKTGLISSKRGELLLTTKDLSFISRGQVLLTISLKEIISANASDDILIIIYKDKGEEKKAKIIHVDMSDVALYTQNGRYGGLICGLESREKYFADWVKEIDDARFERNKNSINNFSVADELKKLNELLKEGVITKSDFDSQKKKLLS